MSKKVRRGQAPLLLLGFLRGVIKRGRNSIWFQLDLRRWAESNDLSYPTALNALQDLATISGDFEVSAGRKRVSLPLPEWAVTAAKEYKFRCIQVKTRTNARFLWHFAPVSRLKWDEEPLFYRKDRFTSRHVRCQLRTTDLQIEASKEPGQYKSSPCSLLKKKEVQPYTTPAGPVCSERSRGNTPGGHHDGHSTATTAACGENALRRKAYAIVPELENVHEFSTGRVPFSRGHAINFLLWALISGYMEDAIFRSYRRAYKIATDYVVDGMVRRSPLAVLLGVAKRLLREHDKLTTADRVAAFYACRREYDLKMAEFHRPITAATIGAPLSGSPGVTDRKPIEHVN